VSFLPYAIAVMFAASASFITPLGYQTNLMIYGLGHYEFTDYIRIGLSLSLLVGSVAIGLIPLVWSFHGSFFERKHGGDGRRKR
jgi:di/tricarboxylate transporter